MKQAITAIETSIENAIQARLALAPNPSGFMAAICETWAQRQERFAECRLASCQEAPVASDPISTTTTTPERAALAAYLWANRRRIDYVDKDYRNGKLYQRIYWAMMPDDDGNLADDSIACTSPRHSCQGPF